MTLLSSARQSRSLGAVFSRSERNSSTERSTRLTMSVPRVALSMAPTVPNPAHTRKNYRSHDQVAVALESSVAIVWCRGWISTQAKDELPPAQQHLGGDHDEGLHEAAELHAQDAVLLVLVALAPPSRDGEQQRGPRLDRPGERGDHHVGPVGLERVERRVQRADAALELRDEVLLVAAAVRLRNDLRLRQLAVVRDVEEVAEVRADGALAALLVDQLPQEDDAVGARRLRGPVLELGGVLRDQALVEVAARLDDLLLHARLLRPRASGELLVGLAYQLLVVAGVDVVGATNEPGVRVVPEHEPRAGRVPPIEVGRHREVGVAAQEHVPVARALAERDRFVERRRRPLVRGPVAAAVEDEERLPP